MDEAIEILCAKHFHQSMWLPENNVHSKLRITYATTGNFDDESLPVILFCTPMFGGRWCAVEADHLASSIGVRIICPDRPGMGGSTRVNFNIRVNVWLEMVPALLKKLKVRYVSLLCHSAGTIYALNTLYHLRDILDPISPFAAIMGPWVYQEHSHATLMNLAAKVPGGMLDSWDKVNKFVGSRIIPVVSWSGGIVSSVAHLFQREPNSTTSETARLAEQWGVTEEVAEYMAKLKSKYYMTEDTSAGNEEAKLCLKKAGKGYWGVCEDYEEFVRLLANAEKVRRASTTSSKLRIDAHFAESDIMIGNGGAVYFQQCFKQDGVSDVIDFHIVDLPGTNHETMILDQKKGGLRTIFEQVNGLNRA